MNVTSILAFVVGKSLMSTWQQAAQSSSCLKVERAPSNPCAANVPRGSQSREFFEVFGCVLIVSWWGFTQASRGQVCIRGHQTHRPIDIQGSHERLGQPTMP